MCGIRRGLCHVMRRSRPVISSNQHRQLSGIASPPHSRFQHIPVSISGSLVSGRWLSSEQKPPSLSEQILNAKKEDEKKSEGQDQKDEAKKGPKPLTKWQKIGYVYFAVCMIGGTITYAVLFCKKKVENYLNLVLI